MIKPIGVIYSPFKELEKMPIQPKSAAGDEEIAEKRSDFRFQ